MKIVSHLKILMLIVLPLSMSLSLGGVSSAQLESLEKVCDNRGAPSSGVSDSSLCAEIDSPSDEDPISGSDGIISRAVNILTIAVAVISVIIIIVAGITMTLSSGDAGKVKSSRDAIIYAVVGIIVVALSRSIVLFVVTRA